MKAFCNKHYTKIYEPDSECIYCRDGIPPRASDNKDTVAYHWPHQPTSEQLTEALLHDHGTLLERLPDKTQTGRKYDSDKPDLSMCPRDALDEMAKAFMYGAKKYERYNYMGGMDWHRLIGAAIRHITAFNEGEDLDPESGISHLGHALASISMLTVYYKRGLGKDDRYKRGST